MKRLHSIRWRLQLWHGLLLILVLGGFIFMAWRMQRATQLQRIDQDLEERISVIAGKMPRGGEGPRRSPQDKPSQERPAQDRLPKDRPPQARLGQDPPPQDQPERDRPPQKRPPQDRPPQNRVLQDPKARPADEAPAPTTLEERLSPRDLSLFEGPPGSAYYYIVWPADERKITRSAAAPEDVPQPVQIAGPRDSRTRGTVRERFHFNPSNGCILVGRDISAELAGSRRFLLILAVAGLVVLGLGWAGGGWISRRALRPIGDISATAARISAGDLSQRIPAAADTGSELGDLVRVLNDTFARLQAGFARQAQFTADASHELRTPISVVLTQTQAALAHERPSAEYRESLEACQRAAQRMRRLIASLLTLARLDSGEAADRREPCGLDRIARDAVELLRPLAQEHRVTIEIESIPTPCDGSAEQLGQVVTNLVGNAIAYNRPEGQVRVKVAAGPGEAVLTVTDTGQGIAPEDLPHIFDRFFRADKVRSGAFGRAGLGLAITKAIVEAHGGTIEVATEWGTGSKFTVRLPFGETRLGTKPIS